MKRKIKLGIIGTGLAAKKLHLPALKMLTNEFEITAVCNHTKPKAEEFSKLVGDAPIYTKYKDLLKNKDIDAVVILLPIELNYKVTKDSLKAGKHVLVEKPLAANLKDARKMLSFDKKFNTVMMVGENFRYRKVYMKAKEILDSGRIGKPYAAQWNIYYHNTADFEYGATKWRQKNVYPGGMILDGGVHNAAALRTLFGELKSVNAFADSINPAIGSHDTMLSLLMFESGVKVHFNMFFTSISHNENRLLIFGDKGTIEINDYVLQVKNPDASVDSMDFGDDSGFYEEYLNFYHAITASEKIKSTFSESYKDFVFLLAMLDSAAKNKTVFMKSIHA